MKFFSDRATRVSKPISREDNYLAKDILLREASNPSYVRNTIILTSIGVVGFLAWAAVADVDVVARAQGQLSPLSSVQVIQHLDGGRISAIHASEGQMVKKGGPLITLDDNEIRAQLETSRTRYWAVYSRHQRLKSFITGAAPNFSSIPDAYRKVAIEEASILALTLRSRADELQVIRAQRSQTAAEASAVRELAEIRGDLASEKLVSRTSYLETLRALNQLDGQSQTLGSQAVAVSSARNRDAAEQLSRTSDELAQLGEEIQVMETRLGRTEIRAPMDGVVQGMVFRTLGGVIAPGVQLMNIVPVADNLEADVRVAASEIGYVRIGQPVRLKIATYDFLRYGTLSGKVHGIAANSTVTDKGESFYMVKVKINRDGSSEGLAKRSLLSGMVVESDIITDSQSVLQYLFAPLFRAVQRAFTER